jgi:hypothetical protein
VDFNEKVAKPNISLCEMGGRPVWAEGGEAAMPFYPVFSTDTQSLRIWDQDKFTAIKRHKKNLNNGTDPYFVTKKSINSQHWIEEAGLQKNLTKTQDVLSLKL